jgi:hypothetical protein
MYTVRLQEELITHIGRETGNFELFITYDPEIWALATWHLCGLKL